MEHGAVDYELVGPLASGPELWSGLLFGAIFGFLLQRAHIVRYDRQIGLLQLQDLTVMKYMLSAAVAGAAGMFLLHDLIAMNWDIRPFMPVAFIAGGLIFGLGWGICGYCPGTTLGAIGEGRWDALWPFLGGVIGSVIYANWVHPHVYKITFRLASSNEGLDLHTALGVSPWLVIAGLAVICGLLFWWFEKRGL
jgi:uncharacterized membrane protein YedE/YeeE